VASSAATNILLGLIFLNEILEWTHLAGMAPIAIDGRLCRV